MNLHGKDHTREMPVPSDPSLQTSDPGEKAREIRRDIVAIGDLIDERLRTVGVVPSRARAHIAESRAALRRLIAGMIDLADDVARNADRARAQKGGA